MKAASLAALIVVSLASSTVRAQSAEAEALFREGKKLLKEGKIAEACAKLEASDRIESTVGSLLNLADCREKNGQTATAWATFRRAVTSARLARDAQRQAEALRREKLLEPRLAHLTLRVEKPGPELAITRNGAEVDAALWDERSPIDPGEYEIVAKAHGHHPWKKHVRVDGSADVVIVVPELDAVVNTEPVEKDHERPPAASRWTGMRKVALVTTILALGAGGAGVAFGLRGQDLQERSDAICPTTICNDSEGLSLSSRARRSALYANIGFATGGALVVTSVILWIAGAPSVTPIVDSDEVGLAYAVTF